MHPKLERTIHVLQKIQPELNGVLAVLSMGSEMVKNRDVFSVARCLLGTMDFAIKQINQRTEPPASWREVLPITATHIFRDALATVPMEFYGNYGDMQVYQITIGDFHFLLDTNPKTAWMLFLAKASDGQLRDARQALFDYLCTRLPHQITVHWNFNYEVLEVGSGVASNNTVQYHPSRETDCLIARLQKYIALKKPRTLMFYGPPGLRQDKLGLCRGGGTGNAVGGSRL